MAYVYLFYGLAFIALGTVLSLQLKTGVNLLNRPALLLVTAFALLHGCGEWAEMASLIEREKGNAEVAQILTQVKTGLIVSSFLCLLAFGIELLIDEKLFSRRLRWAMLALGSLWLVGSWTTTVLLPGEGAPDLRLNAEALSRYLMAFPGAAAAAAALIRTAGEHGDPLKERVRPYLLVGAGAFALYGIFAGLIPGPASFFPASAVNSESFHELLGFPVLVARTFCAAVIATLLTKAFVVEVDRLRADLERKRQESISMVAHDLRSSLSAVSMGTELLKRLIAADRDKAKQSSLCVQISSSAKKLNRLISDLLAASVLETQDAVLQKRRVDLNTWIPAVLERSALLTSGHSLRFEGPGDSIWVEADPTRLDDVLTNLLSNAAKYSFQDSEIVVRLETAQRQAIFSVTNHGPGIRPEELSSVFNRFYRAKGVVGTKTPGVGLGLFIVKKLMQAHGGTVTAKSELQRETTFSCALPLVEGIS